MAWRMPSWTSLVLLCIVLCQAEDVAPSDSFMLNMLAADGNPDQPGVVEAGSRALPQLPADVSFEEHRSQGVAGQTSLPHLPEDLSLVEQQSKGKHGWGDILSGLQKIVPQSVQDIAKSLPSADQLKAGLSAGLSALPSAATLQDSVGAAMGSKGLSSGAAKEDDSHEHTETIAENLTDGAEVDAAARNAKFEEMIQVLDTISTPSAEKLKKLLKKAIKRSIPVDESIEEDSSISTQGDESSIVKTCKESPSTCMAQEAQAIVEIQEAELMAHIRSAMKEFEDEQITSTPPDMMDLAESRSSDALKLRAALDDAERSLGDDGVGDAALKNALNLATGTHPDVANVASKSAIGFSEETEHDNEVPTAVTKEEKQLEKDDRKLQKFIEERIPEEDAVDDSEDPFAAPQEKGGAPVVVPDHKEHDHEKTAEEDDGDSREHSDKSSVKEEDAKHNGDTVPDDKATGVKGSEKHTQHHDEHAPSPSEGGVSVLVPEHGKGSDDKAAEEEVDVDRKSHPDKPLEKEEAPKPDGDSVRDAKATDHETETPRESGGVTVTAKIVEAASSTDGEEDKGAENTHPVSGGVSVAVEKGSMEAVNGGVTVTAEVAGDSKEKSSGGVSVSEPKGQSERVSEECVVECEGQDHVGQCHSDCMERHGKTEAKEEAEHHPAPKGTTNELLARHDDSTASDSVKAASEEKLAADEESCKKKCEAADEVGACESECLESKGSEAKREEEHASSEHDDTGKHHGGHREASGTANNILAASDEEVDGKSATTTEGGSHGEVKHSDHAESGSDSGIVKPDKIASSSTSSETNAERIEEEAPTGVVLTKHGKDQTRPQEEGLSNGLFLSKDPGSPRESSEESGSDGSGSHTSGEVSDAPGAKNLDKVEESGSDIPTPAPHKCDMHKELHKHDAKKVCGGIVRTICGVICKGTDCSASKKHPMAVRFEDSCMQVDCSHNPESHSFALTIVGAEDGKCDGLADDFETYLPHCHAGSQRCNHLAKFMGLIDAKILWYSMVCHAFNDEDSAKGLLEYCKDSVKKVAPSYIEMEESVGHLRRTFGW